MNTEFIETVNSLLQNVVGNADPGSTVSINCRSDVESVKDAVGQNDGNGEAKNGNDGHVATDSISISFTAKRNGCCKWITALQELVPLAPYITIIWLGYIALKAVSVLKGVVK